MLEKIGIIVNSDFSSNIEFEKSFNNIITTTVGKGLYTTKKRFFQKDNKKPASYFNKLTAKTKKIIQKLARKAGIKPLKGVIYFEPTEGNEFTYIVENIIDKRTVKVNFFF